LIELATAFFDALTDELRQAVYKDIPAGTSANYIDNLARQQQQPQQQKPAHIQPMIPQVKNYFFPEFCTMVSQVEEALQIASGTRYPRECWGCEATGHTFGKNCPKAKEPDTLKRGHGPISAPNITQSTGGKHQSAQ